MQTVKKIGEAEVKELQLISKEHPGAKKMFEVLAQRERNRNAIDIVRLKRLLRKENVNSGVIENTIQKLQKMGYGEEEHNKFVLNAPLRLVGLAAINGTKEGDPMPKESRKKGWKKKTRKVIGSRNKTTVASRKLKKQPTPTLLYPLRPGFNVAIPADITANEVKLFVETLTRIAK